MISSVKVFHESTILKLKKLYLVAHDIQHGVCTEKFKSISHKRQDPQKAQSMNQKNPQFGLPGRNTHLTKSLNQYDEKVYLTVPFSHNNGMNTMTCILKHHFVNYLTQISHKFIPRCLLLR